MHDSLQVLSLFLANAGLIAWFRAESRADWRHMDSKLDASIRAIHEDSKDFHKQSLKLEQEFRERLLKIEMEK